MKKTIVVAGSTGNLGRRICRELVQKGAHVKAIVRESSNADDVEFLITTGVEVIKVSNFKKAELIIACRGASCVVSAVTGLRDTIINAQSELLSSAIAANVARFIPSDFSSDFTGIPLGENRNFDLRKEFQELLDESPIRATSIFNGCFADILRYNTPLFNTIDQTIAYYEDKLDWHIDFTTINDTATFTAEAALDDATPRFLRIAGFRVSPNELAALSGKHKGKKFELVANGSMANFSSYNKELRAKDSKGEEELYPKWQQSQYLYSMFLVHHETLDNNRYPGLLWSEAAQNI